MKIISGILGLAILALVLCFALSNQQSVNVTMWPLLGTLQVPLYLASLVPLVFGLIFGGVWGWLTGVPYRFRARWLKNDLERLSDKIDGLQKSDLVHPAFSAQKKHFWERKS